ncbi:hypothetical protein G6F68_017075 [Rhizopus microsporus]|nr:hypothetical protein G6F68_017075 [Rhizopus microsporus]
METVEIQYEELDVDFIESAQEYICHFISRDDTPRWACYGTTGNWSTTGTPHAAHSAPQTPPPCTLGSAAR